MMIGTDLIYVIDLQNEISGNTAVLEETDTLLWIVNAEIDLYR